VRISADGQRADVLATGFRNPDGLGLLPDGSVTVPVSEGEWTPASAINLVRTAIEQDAVSQDDGQPLHFGYRGPRNNAPPELPLAYLPRGLDNSSGGQAFVESQRFGPLASQLLHFSFGAGAWFAVLRDEVAGQVQGGVVPLAGDFLSGVHRGRFHPVDGQLYVSGMAGWGSYTPDDGCFQRVRYTGDAVQLPTGFHVHENGVLVRFSAPLDPAIAGDTARQFAQCWNYRYSGAYGSAEYSTQHPGVAAHDPLMINTAHVLPDGHSLFLEIPELQPVNQLHLRLQVDSEAPVSCSPVGSGHDLFLTVHRLDEPFTEFPGYQARDKTIAAHPLLVDLANNAVRVDNPWRRPVERARAVELQTGKNLSYVQTELIVQAGEPLALTLKNPDVVPHNWVLSKPGSLQRVGGLANQLIAQPDAYARQYVPASDDVLVHTDVVEPGQEQVIYFHAPAVAGRYTYLCTFPGHWMVMNGVMVVE
jgi:azurin